MSELASESASTARPRDGGVTASCTAATDGGADRDVAGLLFARLSVLPALIAAPWLVSGFLMLAAGWFKPAPVTIGAAVLAAPTLYYGLRAVPALPGPEAYALPLPAGREPGRRPARTPWWAVAAVLVIVVAFFGYQVAYHSQFVIITRDPGAYYQVAAWIAGHGSLPVPQSAAAFGGTHGGALSFYSYAAYQVGDSVVLQFMSGLPMVLAGAMWLGGYQAALLMAPLLGALAVLTFSGLAGRLIGPRLAPLAALIAAVSLPVQFTSRSTYSEPLAEILFLGGLIFVIDSLRDDTAEAGPAARRRVRAVSALGGLALGITILVRIDGASDVLPVIPYCGSLFVRRKPQAAPLAIGLAVGAALGVADGLVFSWPYLMQTNRASVLPLAGIIAIVILMTAAGTLYYRRRRLPRWWGVLDKAALALPFLAIAVFAIRPYVQHVHGVNNSGHLVRTYAEIALHWVNWYLGIPVILLAAVGAALLTRRVLRAEARLWVLPLMVLSWGVMTFLYQPAITPDQPWASRRLVPEVIPAFALLAVWALARISAWLRDHGYARATRNAFIAGCGLLVLLPAVVTNWGLGISTSHGVRLRTDGLAGKRTYAGELAGMERLCGKLPANSAVVVLDASVAQRMLQDVRGMCDVPAAAYLHHRGQWSAKPADASAVLSVVRDIQRAGRVPVLLTRSESQLKPYDASGTARHVFTLYTTRDADALHNPPTTPVAMTVDIWMWAPSR